MLLIDGGVFTVYLEDRKLSRAEFFEAAGCIFWRMVRLALYSLVPFGLLMAAGGSGLPIMRKSSPAMLPQERLGFFVKVAEQAGDLCWWRCWCGCGSTWRRRRWCATTNAEYCGSCGSSFELAFSSGGFMRSISESRLFAAASGGWDLACGCSAAFGHGRKLRGAGAGDGYADRFAAVDEGGQRALGRAIAAWRCAARRWKRLNRSRSAVKQMWQQRSPLKLRRRRE